MVDSTHHRRGIFVMLGDPLADEADNGRRSAAIANAFLGAANSGGLNSSLTCTCELDPKEGVEALSAVGALAAAKQQATVVRALGISCPVHRRRSEKSFWIGSGRMNSSGREIS
jgi:hypothetical protein